MSLEHHLCVSIIMTKLVYIKSLLFNKFNVCNDRLIGELVNMSDYNPRGRGFDSRYFYSCKGPPSLMRTIYWVAT